VSTILGACHPDGEYVCGKRKVNEVEAAVVRRIMQEYILGRSPRAIAHDLNHEGVKGPQGKMWNPSTINGNWRRGTGILNNELYIGRLIWNRQRFIKDPMTGKRQSRMNPENEWVVEDVPSLAFVEAKLWDAVKKKQLEMRRKVTDPDTGKVHPKGARRTKHFLSGILKCSCCGGAYSIYGNGYACSNAKNQGTCDNHRILNKKKIEAIVLKGLKDNLMQPEYVEEFVNAFHDELNKLARRQDKKRILMEKELKKVDAETEKLIDAICSGVPAEKVKARMIELDNRSKELKQLLAVHPSSLPRLHPCLSTMYRDKVAALSDALMDDNGNAEAFNALRGLIKEARAIPTDKEPQIELYGELPALIKLANKNPTAKNSEVLVELVAGARYNLSPTFKFSA
ncbi:recombinase family protein, partial [Candidatus Terasakiella magnetica]|uniref:recombinase family protein n=1 Tax=Candidatus Terasakiella magnetica TaxID=1867952 RepID=UPI000F84C9AB